MIIRKNDYRFRHEALNQLGVPFPGSRIDTLIGRSNPHS
jgi:hypothetical protein